MPIFNNSNLRNGVMMKRMQEPQKMEGNRQQTQNLRAPASPLSNAEQTALTNGLTGGGNKKNHNSLDPVVDRFKQLDRDGDLKVSADEYIKDFIEDCLKNGYGAIPGQNFADIINEKYAEFKKYAGDDVSMNIDEFRAMVEARMNEVKNSETQKKPDSKDEQGTTLSGTVTSEIAGETEN